MSKKAAIYTRLSKEDLDKGESLSESIKNQESMLRTYAEQHGWEIYGIYCDEDYSGAYAGDDNIRPEFNRMIKDAFERLFDIVLCKSQSRFSRNMEVVEQYINRRFPEWGIRFVSIVDNADTDIKGNKKSRQIYGMMNEWYLEDLSDNIRAVFRNKMAKGECLMAFAPYGYMKDCRIKNHLVVNPDTAPIVKQIFEWHAEGYGQAKISRMLNDRGIPCPRKQQEIDGKRKTLMYSPNDTGQWSASTIGDILHNQVYCGDIVQHTVEKVSYKSRKCRRLGSDDWIVMKNMHEPIISREMFEAAQRRLASRRRQTAAGRVHILSGKVFCHCCGKPMQKNSSKGKFEYLRCRDKYAYSEKNRCSTPNIRIDTILEALSYEMIEQCIDKAVENQDIKTTFAVLDRERGTDRIYEELDRLKSEREELERKIKVLYNDRLNNVITVQEYSEWSRELSEKSDKLTSRISGAEERLKTKGKECGDIKNRLKTFLRKRCMGREMLDSLVDRIEFGEPDKETGGSVLKIYWAWE